MIPSGFASVLMPALNSVMTPLGVIRPIRSPTNSANHRLPSEPAVMPPSCAPAVMPTLNSVTPPLGVILSIRLP